MRLPSFRIRITALFLPAFILLLILNSLFSSYQERVQLADELLGIWNLPEAEYHLHLLAEEYPDSIGVRRLYAECLLKRGELRKARAQYGHLASVDSLHRLSHLHALSVTLFFLGHLDSAAILAKHAYNSSTGRGDLLGTARSEHILGRIAFNRGSYDSALALQLRSLANMRAMKSVQGEADVLRQIGVLYWYRGDPETARSAFYEPALVMYREINDKLGEATTLTNLALATQNPTYFVDAFAIRKSVGDQIGLADSYYFLGGPAPGSYWNDMAYEFRMKSLELSSSIGYAWGKEVAARAIDQMVYAMYDSLAFRTVAGGNPEPSAEEMILRLQLQSSEYMQSRNYRSAEALRKRVVFLCDSLRYLTGLGVALEQHAQVLVILERYKEAEQAVLRIGSIPGIPPFQKEVALADVYRAAGRYQEAVGLLRSVITRVDGQYQRMREHGQLTLSASMLSLRLHLFEMLVNSLYHLKKVEDAFVAFEGFRSLWIGYMPEGKPSVDAGEEGITQLYHRTVEAIDAGNPGAGRLVDDYHALYTRTEAELSQAARMPGAMDDLLIPQLGDVQKRVGEDHVIVEYFCGRDSAYVLAIRSNRTRFFRLNTAVRDIASSASVFQELLLRGKNSHDSSWKAPSTYLYSSLLQPLRTEGLLRDGDLMEISTMGALCSLPFAALLDSTGKFAVEQFTLNYIPSVTHIVGKDRRVRPEGTALAFVPNVSSLPYAATEAAEIPGALFRQRKIFEEGAATTACFLNESPGADLIHVAAHGKLDRRRPLYSHLLLFDGPLNLHRIFNLRLNARLVTLGACETGYATGVLGDVTFGHTIIGFPHAFLSAGASSVLSPLWVVEDESTAELMRRFYRHLGEGGLSDRRSIARSLAMAQRDFLHDHKDGLSHPFTWAGFYLFSGSRL